MSKLASIFLNLMLIFTFSNHFIYVQQNIKLNFEDDLNNDFISWWTKIAEGIETLLLYYINQQDAITILSCCKNLKSVYIRPPDLGIICLICFAIIQI